MTPDDHISLLSDGNLDAGRGDHVALVTDGDGTRTYAQVHALVSRFAARLADHGVRRGERVLLVLDDTPRFHAAFLGAIRIGAVPVPLNFLLRGADYDHIVGDSYPVLAVVDAPFLPVVGPAAAAHHVPVLLGGAPTPTGGAPTPTGGAPTPTGGAPSTAPEGGPRIVGTVEDWLADGPDHTDPAPTHPDDPAFWLYSSGSTGRPKGVVHMQHAVATTCRRYAEGVLGLRQQDRTFSTTKLFHAYGLGNGLTFPMWVGATAVQMTGRPAPDRALAIIEEQSPTVLFSVPALYNAMLAHPDIDRRDLGSLRIGASAAEALPAEIWRRWHARTGTEVLDGIGSTEMLHIYCSNRPGEVVPGTSGFPVPGYELQLRDDAGAVLEGSDAVGDLHVSGDSMLAGYWHQSAKSRRTLLGRWFLTGDRYRRTPEGAYAYEGRADDMMKVKGLWVSPIDIENRLIEHDAVREAAVVGVEREGLTTIKAYVITVDGVPVDDALTTALQDWCRDGLLRYQFPSEVAYVEDLPRTATGKVQRFLLRAEG